MIRFRHTASKLFAPTLRENPSDAHVASHALLLRAGFIRQTGAGIYTYLPLAQRVLGKISQIIDACMSEIDGQKVTMPLFVPASHWKKSGRWDDAGPELIRVKDRNDGDYCLSPTHEEIVTDLVANDISSHKQLPLKIYQIGTKFRDEARPRFGLLRGREFIMKDMYSFHVDKQDAEKAYAQVSGAYHKIFRALGVDYVMVEADNGNMGGSLSHEFHILANVGEDQLFLCNSCNYSANVEKARSEYTPSDTSSLVASMLKAESRKDLLKLLLSTQDYGANTMTGIQFDRKTFPFAVVMGKHEPNPTKLRVRLGTMEISPQGIPMNQLDSEQLSEIYESIPILVDESMFQGQETRKHADHLQRKFNLSIADFRNVKDGDKCPQEGCSGHLYSKRGIEVGHVFYLGTKYSKSMGALINDPKTNQKIPIEMGCYGIGVSRVMAAVVENSHDNDGIVWPMAVAPYRICVIDTLLKEKNDAATVLYDWLDAQDFYKGEVLLDDRDKSPGFKLQDAELIGYPIVVVVGKALKLENKLEIHLRRGKEASLES
eukprot:TRINITY_DN5593_c0_g1_i6.p1 TRINITY_DN5593_c0_g1~~TRINITY_DN5593_c0_g1_i6.p1  ORF type:complete len:545 (-),score=101.79 TRINITY_DN5593_c0_g1_i6:113-1747(-)